MSQASLASVQAPHLQHPALLDWLARHVPGFQGLQQVQRIEGGQSNPTWVLQAGSAAWVLRAKPGPAASLLPSAHAIEREFHVMQALRNTAVPVPPVHALCEDESILGAAFYVMDFVQGRVLRQPQLPEIASADRAAYFNEAARVLAELHRLDWQALGLQDFGRSQGFFSRLIRRWGAQYRQSIEQPIPAMEHLLDWLPANVPAGADSAGPTRLTHGDFRFENLLFHPTRPQVLAVLDWELATLGHPLSDLAYHCLTWHLPKGILRGLGALQPGHGVPSETQQIQHYCCHAGVAVAQVQAQWPFYLAFNLFRLAAILQGVAHRARHGTSAHSQAAQVGAMATPVAELGWRIASSWLPVPP